MLNLRGVAFVRDGRTILEHVDLPVRAGEHWALIGPNGAGRSRVLSMCGARNHPTRGEVAVLGHEVLTTVSRCFDHPIHVERRHGRWRASAGPAAT
ncbi:ATP-binding cassette domain-containing protein [Oerskovia sp. USHLN155]|uniref:ATP-binding cassette domain-containing protein n=1 Tax=Oerskovia sp. USHLN155 TaxID=3081288 RepID=UPI00301A71F9